MQAIRVKYFGPTNSRGSRLKADCDAGSLTIGYPHDANGQEAAEQAARALCYKLGWTAANGYQPMHGGQLSSGEYVFVFAPREG